MDVNANNEREAREGEEVIFIDTGLLQKAAQGLQRAKEEFRALLDRAEDEARRRGARRMLLNTFSFQAPGFYDRQGYRRFGGVSPCLGEYGQYFYVKELQNNPPHRAPARGERTSITTLNSREDTDNRVARRWEGTIPFSRASVSS